MNVGAFLMTSELPKPFSVHISKHRGEIRFYSVHRLKKLHVPYVKTKSKLMALIL